MKTPRKQDQKKAAKRRKRHEKRVKFVSAAPAPFFSQGCESI